MFAISLNLKGSRVKKVMLIAFMIIVYFAVILILPKLKNSRLKDLNADFSQETAREFYLNTNGWDVDLVSEQKITIPTEFSQTYEEYNVLQKSMGFDLRQFMGKRATLYTYAVNNYDETFGDVRASLIVCDKEIIAADLYLYEQGGFLRGIKP